VPRLWLPGLEALHCLIHSSLLTAAAAAVWMNADTYQPCPSTALWRPLASPQGQPLLHWLTDGTRPYMYWCHSVLTEKCIVCWWCYSWFLLYIIYIRWKLVGTSQPNTNDLFGLWFSPNRIFVTAILITLKLNNCKQTAVSHSSTVRRVCPDFITVVQSAINSLDTNVYAATWCWELSWAVGCWQRCVSAACL